MRGRRRMPKKAVDKFRGGRGSEVKKKGQKWKMEGKSIKKTETCPLRGANPRAG